MENLFQPLQELIIIFLITIMQICSFVFE